MGIEFFLNLIVIVLLVPTIVFAVILNKRLEILRNSRNDLGCLIEAFNDATTRAESGIPRLKQAADSTGAVLRDQIQKAQTLRDDLAFMIERAEAAAGKMETALNARAAASAVREAKPAQQSRGFDIDDSEKPARKSKKKPMVESDEDLISSAVYAAEDILRKTERSAPARSAAKEPVFTGDDGERSEAERELLKALRSMR